jgi:tRNA A-37 threonylcarbamoyl transferase component Bud32
MRTDLEITTGLEPVLAAAGIRTALDALDPALGEPVVASRSSWVRRVPAGDRSLYVKCFVYPTLKDVALRVVSRRFLWHRARREWRSIALQERLGLPTVNRVALGEVRRLGILRAAALVTEEVRDAIRLDRSLRGGSPPALPGNLGSYVARMHLAGFTHGDLNARNVLVSGDGADLRNVDSGRGRLQPWRFRFTAGHLRDVAPLVLALRVLSGQEAAEALLAEYLEEMDLGVPADFQRRLESEIGRIEAKETARLDGVG